ncbi:MAG: hypothetical protein ACK4ZJ_18460, partial [Allorhizobium sp.]
NFLRPDRQPGYWHLYLDPADPSSAQVEGAISVCDLQERSMSTLVGYFSDPFVRITLPAYLLASAQ